MSVKKPLLVITVISFLLVTVAAVYAVNIYSPASEVTNGAVSIAFDDGKQSQYDYAFQVMKSRGIVGTFYVVTDYIRDFSFDNAYMNIAELQDLQNYGCEIASHSKSHPDFLYLSETQMRQECSSSKQVLQSYGFTVNNFAYPYGDRNDYVDSIVSQYYRSVRSAYVPPFVMQLPTSQVKLTAWTIWDGDSADHFSQMKSMVDAVCAAKGWAIIFFHNVTPEGGRDSSNTVSTGEFTQFLDYVIAKGVKTLTVNQALDTGSLEPDQPPQPPTPQPSEPITVTITMQPFGMTMEYTLNSGDAWTAPARISTWEREWAFAKWSDGSTNPTKAFTSGGNYEITYV